MNRMTNLIHTIVKDGKMTNEDIINHLVEALENSDEDFSKEYMELYEASYGKKLNRDLAENWVKHMFVPEGIDRPDGMKWSYDAAVEVGTKNGIDWTVICKTDWFVVLNMMYSDYHDTATKFDKANDSMFYSALAKDWLCDEDVSENKLFNYYFHVVKS